MNGKRMHNLDMLRVLLMCLVVTLHFLNQLELLPTDGVSFGAPLLYAVFLRSLSLCAVNTFVILAGYVGYDKPFSAGRFAERLLTVVFYALGVYAACAFLGILTASEVPFYYRILQLFFPVSNGHYWFFTAFLMLMLLQPFLNAGLKILPEKTFRTLLFLLLLFQCLIKSVIPLRFVHDNGGYGFDWFLCLYLVGAYLKVRGLPERKNGLRLYAGSVLVLFLLTFLLPVISAGTGKLRDYSLVTADYNYLPCLTAAVGLFVFFAAAGEAEHAAGRFCTRIAPYLPGVYLLHVHQQTDRRWLQWFVPFIGEVQVTQPLRMTLQMLACVGIIMTCGIVVDMIRAVLFHLFTGRAVKL